MTLFYCLQEKSTGLSEIYRGIPQYRPVRPVPSIFRYPEHLIILIQHLANRPRTTLRPARLLALHLLHDKLHFQSNMKSLHEQLQQVRRQIAAAERQFGREAGSVKLLAVSKTRSHADILSLAQLGQLDFGENYVQEALGKIRQLTGQPLTWHFIGPVQSNKTRQIAGHFHWIHSVDRIKIANRLNAARPSGLPPLNICIQVNVDAEPGKAGVAMDEAGQLARQVLPLSRLRLRGLMALPALSNDFTAQRLAFAKLRDLYDRLISAGYPLDTLSMGTTNDMPAAIAEGATLVRIGAALFGPRT